MKYIRNILTAFFLLVAEYTLADNIYIDDITIQKGKQKELSIGLQNAEREYTAFQMDLKIPEEITVVRNADGEPIIQLIANRTQDHTFSVVEVEPGTFRLLAYSMANKQFKGNTGGLVTVLVEPSLQASMGDYTISLQNQRFTDKAGTKYIFADVQATVTVQEPLLTITANSYTRFYGEENPSFEYTTDGTTLIGTPQIVCEATPSSPIGEYPIKVQTGSVSNGNVKFVDGILTIKKASLSIVADNKTKKQGDQMPEFTATYSGFKNGENASALSTAPQFSCNANESSAPGSYDIEVFGAEATNYDISYKKAILTVTKADEVVVTVKNYSRKYGESNPSKFEYTVEGGTLYGEPSISCAADVISPVGDYDIVISKGSVTNYNITFVNGLLTVEKARLTIQADDKEMLIGGQLPEFTATYQGFKNNETISALTKMPEFQCSATSQSAGGNYTISVLGAEAQNYDFSYKSGRLTIVDPPLLVTVVNAEREYGDNNPNFEYVVEGGNLIGQPSFTCNATNGSQVGTYDIVIGQGTVLNSNVTYKNGVLTVKKAPLKIKADDKTILLGEELPIFTASYDGFKLNDDENSLQKAPVFTCNIDNTSQTGEFQIVVKGAEAINYDIIYNNGVLRVVEALITVRAVDKRRLYGETNPIFDYIVEGGELQGKPVLRCEATPNSNVGEYEIVIEKGEVTNSHVTFINGVMYIEKAPLTITADDKLMVLGEDVPQFTATYSGFKNEDTQASLDNKPRFSCSATSNSDPGEYTIEVSGAQAKNYAITYVSGILTIKQSPLVVAEVSNPVAGLLSAQLEQNGIAPLIVNELKINGSLNGTDIKCIREMIIKGNLTVLDIQNTSIVSGGEPYYGDGILEQRTQNDVVGQFMFYDCKNLISIRLPNTVTKIEFAFDDCDNLLRLDIPESCIEFGLDAISCCPSLTTITIPSNTQIFDSYNCSFCPSLKTIEVNPDNKWLTSEDGVLYSHNMDILIKYPMGKQEPSFVVPESVVSIDDYAFYGSSFNTIKLPSNLSSIGSGAFGDCENLTEIEIPQSVVSIGMFIFDDCDNLRSLSLPEGLTEIPDFCACYCEKLSSISLPSSIQTIGYAAFAYCKSLTKIECYISDIGTIDFETDYESGEVNAFEGIPNNCSWHVLYGTKNIYLSLPWWIDSWSIYEDVPVLTPKETSQDYLDNSWYTLDGTRLFGKPNQSGIYLHRGKKVLIK